MTDTLAIYRTIDKRDRIGLLGVFNALVGLGLPRWQALAWVYWIGPVSLKKRILDLAA